MRARGSRHRRAAERVGTVHVQRRFAPAVRDGRAGSLRDTRIPVRLGRDPAPPGELVEIELRGRVRRAVDVPQRAVDFGQLTEAARSKPRVVPLRELVPLRDLASVGG